MKKAILAFVILIAAFSASAETYADSNSKTIFHIGDSDNVSGIPRFTIMLKEIETKTGDMFIITLDSNRTTGYEWQLVKPFDNKAIELLGVEYVAGSGGMPGAGGLENWTFRTISFRRDKVVLSFKYVRPWEKDVKPVKETEFFVKIEKGPVERRLEGMQKDLDKVHNESWDTSLSG